MNIFDFDYTLLIRLAAAVVLGGLIGFERDRTNHDAGFRTHIILCLGAASVMVISECLVKQYDAGQEIMRMGAQVVSGIGFLGMGSIIVEGNRVRGITTAAGLWTTACVGIAAGSGYYIIALTVVLLMLFAMYFLRMMKKRMRSGEQHAALIIDFGAESKPREVIELLMDEGAAITSMKAERENQRLKMSLAVVLPKKLAADRLICLLSEFDCVDSVNLK